MKLEDFNRFMEDMGFADVEDKIGFFFIMLLLILVIFARFL